MVGHHDRVSFWNMSWNSSHSTRVCSREHFNDRGGAGRFYCFAEDWALRKTGVDALHGLGRIGPSISNQHVFVENVTVDTAVLQQ